VGYSGQQKPNRVRNRQADFGQHGGSLLLHLIVYAGLNKPIGRHNHTSISRITL
jgi:hypothetical protein